MVGLAQRGGQHVIVPADLSFRNNRRIVKSLTNVFIKTHSHFALRHEAVWDYNVLWKKTNARTQVLLHVNIFC